MRLDINDQEILAYKWYTEQWFTEFIIFFINSLLIIIWGFSWAVHLKATSTLVSADDLLQHLPFINIYLIFQCFRASSEASSINFVSTIWKVLLTFSMIVYRLDHSGINRSMHPNVSELLVHPKQFLEYVDIVGLNNTAKSHIWKKTACWYSGIKICFGWILHISSGYQTSVLNFSRFSTSMFNRGREE